MPQPVYFVLCFTMCVVTTLKLATADSNNILMNNDNVSPLSEQPDFNARPYKGPGSSVGVTYDRKNVSDKLTRQWLRMISLTPSVPKQLLALPLGSAFSKPKEQPTTQPASKLNSQSQTQPQPVTQAQSQPQPPPQPQPQPAPSRYGNFKFPSLFKPKPTKQPMPETNSQSTKEDSQPSTTISDPPAATAPQPQPQPASSRFGNFKFPSFSLKPTKQPTPETNPSSTKEDTQPSTIVAAPPAETTPQPSPSRFGNFKFPLVSLRPAKQPIPATDPPSTKEDAQPQTTISSSPTTTAPQPAPFRFGNFKFPSFSPKPAKQPIPESNPSSTKEDKEDTQTSTTSAAPPTVATPQPVPSRFGNFRFPLLFAPKPPKQPMSETNPPSNKENTQPQTTSASSSAVTTPSPQPSRFGGFKFPTISIPKPSKSTPLEITTQSTTYHSSSTLDQAAQSPASATPASSFESPTAGEFNTAPKFEQKPAETFSPESKVPAPTKTSDKPEALTETPIPSHPSTATATPGRFRFFPLFRDPRIQTEPSSSETSKPDSKESTTSQSTTLTSASSTPTSPLPVATPERFRFSTLSGDPQKSLEPPTTNASVSANEPSNESATTNSQPSLASSTSSESFPSGKFRFSPVFGKIPSVTSPSEKSDTAQLDAYKSQLSPTNASSELNPTERFKLPKIFVPRPSKPIAPEMNGSSTTSTSQSSPAAPMQQASFTPESKFRPSKMFSTRPSRSSATESLLKTTTTHNSNSRLSKPSTDSGFNRMFGNIMDGFASMTRRRPRSDWWMKRRSFGDEEEDGIKGEPNTDMIMNGENELTSHLILDSNDGVNYFSQGRESIPKVDRDKGPNSIENKNGSEEETQVKMPLPSDSKINFSLTEQVPKEMEHEHSKITEGKAKNEDGYGNIIPQAQQMEPSCDNENLSQASESPKLNDSHRSTEKEIKKMNRELAFAQKKVAAEDKEHLSESKQDFSDKNDSILKASPLKKLADKDESEVSLSRRNVMDIDGFSPRRSWASTMS